MDQSNSNLLQEFETEMFLEPVSPGVRFANFIIDRIVTIAIIIGMMVLQDMSILFSDNVNAGVTPNEAFGGIVLEYLFIYLLIVGYYTLFEAASKGRTIGKLITGTVAVKDDGTPLTFKDALLRSLCRIIPFEPFSAFGGRPWHDTITNTMVIKKPR